MITPFDPCPPEAEWRICPRNDHYEVSEYGHLRRAVGGSNSKKGKLIKPRRNDRGYVTYGLNRDGRRKDTHAHRLVGEAFLANARGLPYVLHNDGNPVNCHRANLRWGTAKENTADAKRHGTFVANFVKGQRPPLWGAAHPASKLTEDQAALVLASPLSARALARQLGVDKAVIQRIRQGTAWKHLRRPSAAEPPSSPPKAQDQ